MIGGRAADLRKRLGEGDHLAVLVLIPHFAPFFVIAILLSAAVVAPHRLDVPARVGADPDVVIRRRNGEGFDAMDREGVLDPLALVVDVNEAGAALAATD